MSFVRKVVCGMWSTEPKDLGEAAAFPLNLLPPVEPANPKEIFMKLGLIGEVLGHSLSPIIHEKLFHKLSIPGRYDLIEIPKDHFAEVLRDTLTARDGLNVTIPYKLDVIPFLDDISPEAKTIGAVNTIARTDGKLMGYNTDYFGFQRTLRKIDAKVNGKTAVVLGHGGASRAIIQCLYDEGAAEIRVISRHLEKVDSDLRSFAEERRVRLMDYAAFEREAEGALLVNATPVGMYPKVGVSPISEEAARHFSKVIDIIYNPKETRLLHDASHADKANGMYMLVMQAIAAEEIWLEREIPDRIAEEIAEEMGN